jgi:hypothetical protein
MSRLFLPLVLVAGFVCGVFAPPASAALDTVVTFDAPLPPGVSLSATPITDQYLPAFEVGAFTEFHAATTGTFCDQPAFVEPSPAATSGANVLASQSAGCTLQPRLGRSRLLLDQRGGFQFRFLHRRNRVSMREGSPGIACTLANPAPAGQVTCHSARLSAYDIDGRLITQADAPLQESLMPLTVVAPGQTIAYAVLSGIGGNGPLAVDDVTVDNPDVPNTPEVRVGVATPTLTLHQGATGSLGVKLLRFDGSTGPVDLQASGLSNQDIVSSSFDPNPAGGPVSTFTATARRDATIGASTLTITATPLTPAAGTSAPPPATASVQILRPFSIAGVGQSISLAPCETRRLPFHITGSDGFTDAVDVGAHTPPGVTSSVDPDRVTPAFDAGDTTLSLTSGPAVVAPGTATFFARSFLFGVQTQDVSITGEPSRASFGADLNEFRHAFAGAYGATYSGVTIRGKGWCPGARVQFGNDEAVVPLDFRVESDRSLRADVTLPATATSGAVEVIQPGGTRLPAGHLDVDYFRSVDGFPFKNPSVRLRPDDNDMRWLFGARNVDAQIDVCSALSFGLLKCSIGDAGVLKPSTAIALEAYKAAFDGNGLCFGVTAAMFSTLFHQGVAASFGSATGHAFGVPTVAGGPRDDLATLIHHLHFAQMSDEVITWRTKNHPQNRNDAVAQIKAALGKLDPPLIGIRAGGKGHALGAVGVESLPDGTIAIDVYDPNTPFDPRDDARNQIVHTQTSRVILKPDNSWSFAGFSPAWTGRIDDSLYVLPRSAVPGEGQGKLPAETNIDFMVGADGGVTDDHGRALPSAPVADAGSSGSVVPAADDATYTVRPGRGGVTGAVSRDFSAFAQQGGGAASAPVRIDGRAGLVDAGRAKGRVTVSAAVAAGRGTEHAAKVSAGHGVSVDFSARGGQLVVRATGPVSVTLTSTSKSGTSAIELRGLHPRGGRLAIAPTRWGALGDAAVRVNGRRVRGRALRAASVTLGTPSAKRVNARTVRVTVRVRVRRAARGVGGAVTVVLTRACRRVALKSVPLDAGKLAHGGQTATVDLRAAPGRYALSAGAIVQAPNRNAVRARSHGRAR